MWQPRNDCGSMRHAPSGPGARVAVNVAIESGKTMTISGAFGSEAACAISTAGDLSVKTDGPALRRSGIPQVFGQG
jgi:hypothetical protein